MSTLLVGQSLVPVVGQAFLPAAGFQPAARPVVLEVLS
jgi:hypothetical protein